MYNLLNLKNNIPKDLDMSNIEKSINFGIELYVLVNSEEEFKNKFFNEFNQFNGTSNLNITIENYWKDIKKPCEYPCFVIYTASRFQFIYKSDFEKKDNLMFPGTHNL